MCSDTLFHFWDSDLCCLFLEIYSFVNFTDIFEELSFDFIVFFSVFLFSMLLLFF